MLIVVACVAVMLRPPPLPSRAAFYRALAQVQGGMSQADVRRLLGPPDDVLLSDDLRNHVPEGSFAWCYGTDGHQTLPTLTRIEFHGGKVGGYPGRYWPPPSLDVIGEAELRATMRQIYRSPESPCADFTAR